jgi:hypothetical protein
MIYDHSGFHCIIGLIVKIVLTAMLKEVEINSLSSCSNGEKHKN